VEDLLTKSGQKRCAKMVVLNLSVLPKGKRDVFAVVIAFKYLFTSPHFLKFRKSLKSAIDAYLMRTQAVTESQLYDAMGFPPNWAKIGRYRKLR